jgi:hypothetical protein
VRNLQREVLKESGDSMSIRKRTALQLAEETQVAQGKAKRQRRHLISGVLLGRIVGVAAGGALVELDGRAAEPLLARLAVPLEPQALAAAARADQRAVLAFEDGDPARPLLLGLLQPPQGPRLLDAERSGSAPQPSAPIDAKVDGRRVVIEGRDEVVLRCGEATITLSRDGKVEVRGTRVVSTARGTNRIRGGAVQIN